MVDDLDCYLIQLGLTAAESAADLGISKKIIGSWRPLDLAPRTATLIVSNKEKWNIMKIDKSLEKFALLIKGVTKTTEKETKQQKGEFLSMVF